MPTTDSPLYRGPVQLSESAQLKVIAFHPEQYQSQMVSQHFLQLPNDWSVRLANAPHPRYTGGGAFCLIDGETGDLNYGSGAWMGFQEVGRRSGDRSWGQPDDQPDRHQLPSETMAAGSFYPEWWNLRFLKTEKIFAPVAIF